MNGAFFCFWLSQKPTTGDTDFADLQEEPWTAGPGSPGKPVFWLAGAKKPSPAHENIWGIAARAIHD
jgi:hypothetical protein